MNAGLTAMFLGFGIVHNWGMQYGVMNATGNGGIEFFKVVSGIAMLFTTLFMLRPGSASAMHEDTVEECY